MNRPTILIVEDQLELRELLKMTLAVLDAQIVEAESGEDAIKVFREYSPSLVVLDLELPGKLDGIEVCDTIKGENPNTRVILATTRSRQSDIDSGRNAGADFYFIKPFSPKDLLQEAIRQLENI